MAFISKCSSLWVRILFEAYFVVGIKTFGLGFKSEEILHFWGPTDESIVRTGLSGNKASSKGHRAGGRKAKEKKLSNNVSDHFHFQFSLVGCSSLDDFNPPPSAWCMFSSDCFPKKHHERRETSLTQSPSKSHQFNHVLNLVSVRAREHEFDRSPYTLEKDWRPLIVL